jgi:uncharacterized membrane protein (DUF2068 family)
MLDYSTLWCGLRGHITYAPDESDLADALRATTPAGMSWRCLRCGAYVPGDPHGHGPADLAPTPPRGKALRQLIVLRLLAILRLIEGLAELAIGLTLFGLQARVPDVVQALKDELPLLVPAAERIGWNIENSWIARTIDDIAGISPGSYGVIGLGIAALGLIKLAEAVGLWLAKRWGEYLSVIATSAFIPIEIRELIVGITPFKVTIFIINVAAVVWLIWAKRLFGVRGGRAAAETEVEEASFLAVEKAASGG